MKKLLNRWDNSLTSKVGLNVLVKKNPFSQRINNWISSVASVSSYPSLKNISAIYQLDKDLEFLWDDSAFQSIWIFPVVGSNISAAIIPLAKPSGAPDASFRAFGTVVSGYSENTGIQTNGFTSLDLNQTSTNHVNGFSLGVTTVSGFRVTFGYFNSVYTIGKALEIGTSDLFFTAYTNSFSSASKIGPVSHTSPSFLSATRPANGGTYTMRVKENNVVTSTKNSGNNTLPPSYSMSIGGVKRENYLNPQYTPQSSSFRSFYYCDTALSVEQQNVLDAAMLKFEMNLGRL